MLILGIIQIPRWYTVVSFYRHYQQSKQSIPDCLLQGSGGALLILALLFTNWALYVHYTLIEDNGRRYYKLGFFTTN